MAINMYLSIITLNVNGLTAPIKTQGSWINKKTRPTYIMSTRDPPSYERYTQTKNKEIKRDISYKCK